MVREVVLTAGVGGGDAETQIELQIAAYFPQRRCVWNEVTEPCGTVRHRAGFHPGSDNRVLTTGF